jgi:hypothetical protein
MEEFSSHRHRSRSLLDMAGDEYAKAENKLILPFYLTGPNKSKFRNENVIS